MRCGYKKAAAESQKVELCNYLGEKWLDFVESLTVVEVHNVLGWGSKRIADMRDGTAIRLNEEMTRFYADDETVWDTAQTANVGLLRDLSGIGFDLLGLHRSIPVKDNFRSWSARNVRQHDFRRNWVDTMETKLLVYYAVLCLYLNNEKGIGAVRLGRLCEQMRRKYVRFAGLYLSCTDAADAELKRMLNREITAANEIMGSAEDGYTDGAISVDEFIEKMRGRAKPWQIST